MSKLREKFQEVITKEFDKADKCEQIADDFAVKFAEWNHKEGRFIQQDLTTIELLQIFKDKYYQ